MTYYNEVDPFCAQWCRNAFGGEVDERDIRDIGHPTDAVRQHYFAGLGGWEWALRLAGWPDDREVWTGSCPCQPFSAAGRQQGLHDERDLWPPFFKLIAERRPEWVFGEQVEAAIRWGWLDRICDDLASCRYTVRAVVLPASSVGAPHIRSRLFWVAYAGSGGTSQHAGAFEPERRESGPCGEANGLADADRSGRNGTGLHLLLGQSRPTGIDAAGSVETGWLAFPDTRQCHGLAAGEGSVIDRAQAGWQQGDGSAERSGETGGLALAAGARCDDSRKHRGGQPLLSARSQQRSADGWLAFPELARREETGNGPVIDAGNQSEQGRRAAGGMEQSQSEGRTQPERWSAEPRRTVGGLGDADLVGLSQRERHGRVQRAALGASQGQTAWSRSQPIYCADGKWRRVPVKSEFFPLADSGRFGNPRTNPHLSSRIGALKAAGNAIVIPLAAEFIRAVMDNSG